MGLSIAGKKEILQEIELAELLVFERAERLEREEKLSALRLNEALNN